jgi:hypothetical protein
MPATLTLYLPERPARRVDLQPNQVMVVGRDPSCDIVMADTRVSRRHARLSWREGCCVLEDLRSKNGTYVNGVRSPASTLEDHDWISFGGVVARFDLPAADQSRRAETAVRRVPPATPEGARSRRGPDARRVLYQLLRSAMELTGGERGVVLLAGEDGMIRPAVASGFPRNPSEDEPFAGSAGAIERALATGASVVVTDAQHDGFFSKRQSVLEGRLATLACVPLRAHRGTAGLLYVDGRSTLDGFTELDLQILEAIGEQAALVIATMCVTRDLQEIVLSLPAPLSREIGALRDRIGQLATEAGFAPRAERTDGGDPGGAPQPAVAW